MQKLKTQRTNLSLTHPSNPTTNSPLVWGENGWAQLNGNFAEVTKVTSPYEAKKCTRSPSLKTGDRVPPGSPRSPLGGRADRPQPSAAWRGRPGRGRGALGYGGQSRAARGPLAGPARRAGAGVLREGPHSPPRARGRRPGPPHRTAPWAPEAERPGAAAVVGALRRGLSSPSRTSPGLTCLSRETSTVLTPVISRFRRFSSDLRSMTRRSVIFLPSA